jgi:hypothetical protein
VRRWLTAEDPAAQRGPWRRAAQSFQQEVHHICGEQALHYENMVNLHRLIGRGVSFIGLPLRIRGEDWIAVGRWRCSRLKKRKGGRVTLHPPPGVAGFFAVHRTALLVLNSAMNLINKLKLLYHEYHVNTG